MPHVGLVQVLDGLHQLHKEPACHLFTVVADLHDAVQQVAALHEWRHHDEAGALGVLVGVQVLEDGLVGDLKP